jgi:hypothetical protein
MSKETMTPHEWVKTALNHQEPDRVPLDLGGFQKGLSFLLIFIVQLLNHVIRS